MNKIKNLFAKLKNIKFKNKTVKVVVIAFTVIVLLLLLLGIFLGLPLKSTYQKALKIKQQANALSYAVSQKDTNLIKKEIENTNALLVDLEKSYSKMAWLKIIPKAKDYYLDGERAIVSGKEGLKMANIFVDAIEPYSDFLGLNGRQEEMTSEKTTEDRIGFLVESVQGLSPKLDEIQSHLVIIDQNINQIDPQRYPEELKGMGLRKSISKAQTALDQLLNLVANGRPLIEKADWLLGKDEPRKYLFLFQNDAELRPTGGFWTAYGIISVDNGKVTPLVSEDIYALDSRLGNTVEAPRPILDYHKNVYYWHIRDMNLSPDFKVSAEQFMTYFEKASSQTNIDGIIAIDTNVLVDILSVLGRVGVPGWGNFEADPDDRCWGCPQVVYQLELLADKPTYEIRADRKGFLAPLMHSIIANIFGSPKEDLAPLASAIWKNIETKHLLTYFFDDQLQKGSEGIGTAGRIKDFQGDYFHFNDSNFGGAKSNLFISQTVKQEYTVSSDRTITKKVTINYKNSAPASDCNLESGNLCLNGLYRDWFRLYTPEGSELSSLVGSEVEPVVYQELGKTVFEGFFGDQYPLRPEGIAKVVYQYTLPFKAEKALSLLIQKQPGKDAVEHEIWVNDELQQKITVDSDTIVNLSF